MKFKMLISVYLHDKCNVWDWEVWKQEKPLFLRIFVVVNSWNIMCIPIEHEKVFITFVGLEVFPWDAEFTLTKFLPSDKREWL